MIPKLARHEFTSPDRGKILNWADEPGVKSADSQVGEKAAVWFRIKGCSAVSAPIEHVMFSSDVNDSGYRVADKANLLINF